MRHAINYFSAPLPFKEQYIDYIAEINESHKLSKINMLYNCLPLNSLDKCGFEQHRCWDENVNSLNDLIKLVNRAKSYNIGFTYLINSVNTPNIDEFRTKRNAFDKFLSSLLNAGIKNLRVSNTFLVNYINSYFPEFILKGSTSQEYYSLKQYSNYLNYFSSINNIVPSWDINKNFTFLKNIKKKYPKLEIELMVNEGCIAGCPFRRDHHSSNIGFSKHNDEFARFFNLSCSDISNFNKALYICLSNIIYPWEINKYNEYGIHHFKFVGRNAKDFINGTKYLERYSNYLDGIENIENIMDKPFIDFNNYLLGYIPYEKVLVKDIIKLLPRIDFFEKMGTYAHLYVE